MKLSRNDGIFGWASLRIMLDVVGVGVSFCVKRRALWPVTASGGQNCGSYGNSRKMKLA
jgi:hypothetical protein